MDAPPSQSQKPFTIYWNLANFATYVMNVVVTAFLIKKAVGDDANVTLITPAAYAFSIWGLIFASEAVFVITQLLPWFRQAPLVSPKASMLWNITMTAQTGWVISAASDDVDLSTAMIIISWLSLLGLVVYQQYQPCSLLQFLLLAFPFYFHFAWVTSATAISINVYLDFHSDGDPDVLVAAAISTLALLVMLCAVFPYNIVLSGVSAWALLGMHVELNNPSQYIHEKFPSCVIQGFQTACLVLCLSLVLLCAVNCVLEFFAFFSSICPCLGGSRVGVTGTRTPLSRFSRAGYLTVEESDEAGGVGR